MNIYIGNLSFDASEDDLRQLFEGYGEVTSAKIVMDRETGRSRGFAFVEMSDDTQAQAAIDDTNGKEFKGREMRVNQARPRTDGPGGGGGRGRF
jgi:RNA recognition motif-containing protein